MARRRETDDRTVETEPDDVGAGRVVDLVAEIMEFGRLQFLEAEIAEALELDETEAARRFSNPMDSWAQALRRGHLLGEAQVRRALFDFAAEGGVPAAREALALVKARKGAQE